MADTESTRSKKWKWAREAAAAIVVTLVLAVFLPLMFSADLTGPSPLERSDLLTLLALVIALAAYLATVGQALKGKIIAARKKADWLRRWNEKRPADSLQAKIDSSMADAAISQGNLDAVIEAEKIIVLLGLLIAGWLVIRPLVPRACLFVIADRTFGCAPLVDYFVLVGFFLIVIKLAALHVRQWRR